MNRIDVSEIIDKSRISSFQCFIVALCGLCVVMDGFDVQAMGYAAPAIIKTLHIEKSSFGLIFSAGFVGMAVGSICLGILADVIGKRRVLVGATLFMVLCLAGTAYASRIDEFVALRFLTGISMGTLVPNALALVNEYSPTKLKIRLVIMTGAGFVVGGALGGFLAAQIIPVLGWQSLFLAAAIIALVTAVAMLVALPDSLQFLILRGTQPEKIRKLLLRMDPTLRLDSNTVLSVGETKKNAESVVVLFKAKMALGTVLLWVVNFMSMLCLYFFASWLPVLISDAGYAKSAVYAGTAFWVGGVVGCLVLSWLVNRRGFGLTVTVEFLVAAICVVALGQASASLLLIFISVTGAGMCLLGAPPTLNALSATFYPSSIRATGMGWAQGIGRLGSILGPLIGGELIRRGFSSYYLFNAALIPILGVILCGVGFWVFQIPYNHKKMKASPESELAGS